jgi:hypothetical protein
MGEGPHPHNAALSYQAYYGRHGGVYVHPEDPDYLEKGFQGFADAATRTAVLGHTYYCINAYGEQIGSLRQAIP